MDETKRLWAPWRHAYISGAAKPTRGCIFCLARRSRDNRRAYVLVRGTHVLVMLNRYPYNPGHLMIAPTRHVGDYEALRSDETAELSAMSQRMVGLLRQALHPQGFNLGMNVGRVAGAGIPGHLHLHIVPRWNGDVNFMPVTGHAKVMSDSLEALYDRCARLLPGEAS